MKVRGRDFDVTKQEVETRMKGEEPELIQKHMVQVNGQMFPPKQVLEHVTGWARTSFTTAEAQRVLTRIGLDCTEAPGAPIRQLVGGVFRDAARQVVDDHGAGRYQEGFTAAADIALGLIEEKLKASREQMKSTGLSPPEQAVFAHLDELKSEIEASWDRAGDAT